MNPRKGYIVNANNRVVPDNSASDLGATTTSTARSQRITEMIRRQLEIGQAFRLDEVTNILNDKVDVHARGVFHQVMQLAHNHKHLLNKEEQQELESLFKIKELQ